MSIEVPFLTLYIEFSTMMFMLRSKRATSVQTKAGERKELSNKDAV